MKELNSISIKNITPEELFLNYILKRQPIKFIDQLQSEQKQEEQEEQEEEKEEEKKIKNELWNISNWTNDYLKNKAGHCKVKVEFRENNQGRFGKGNEHNIEFKQFLEYLENGDQRWYLTTQKLEYTPEGQPKIISNPITSLIDDIPIRPKIMGNLIPQNINLWMGSSDRPTTSGLHHDFHDNIYILLRGQKIITLYPPSEYKNMYLVGNVTHLHPNGRFNYQGQPTRADGSCIGSEEAFNASKLLDEAVLKLENDESGAEEEIENALEALLDAQTEGFGDEEDEDNDDFDEDNLQDDYIDSDVPNNSDNNNEEDEDNDFDENEDDEEDKLEAEYFGLKKRNPSNDLNQIKKKKKKLLNKSQKKNHENSKNDNEDNEEEEESLSKKDPPSFSRVDTQASREEIEAKFPLFLQSESKGYTVTLQAGEMLYLPAGWFHEVKSLGLPEQGGHMALNYWFHPPDGTSFEQPYVSDFWENDWKQRKFEEIHQNTSNSSS